MKKYIIISLICIITILAAVYIIFGKNIQIGINNIEKIAHLDYTNVRIITIPDKVYQNTTKDDFFYNILNSDSDKRFVYVMYSKNSEESQKFLNTVSNAIGEAPLNLYYTIKSQAIEDRTEPQIKQDIYQGNIWFIGYCGSFCIIDSKNKRVLTPDISTKNKDPLNRGKAMNFLNDAINY